MSGDWRDEYVAQGVDPEGDDDATPEADAVRLTIGTVLHDRDDEDPSDAVVVALPSTTADECRIEALEQTVADVNPGYPAGARMVTVVFRRRLEGELPSWRSSGAAAVEAAVADGDLPTYDYPAPRLEVVGDG